MALKIKPYRVKTPDVDGFTETMKFHVMACGNINSNNNKFYCIELQKNPVKTEYRIFTHYGRIGKTNVYEVRDACQYGTFGESNFSTLEDEFDKIVKKKKRIVKGKSTYETVDTTSPSVGSNNIRNTNSASASAGSSQKGDLTILGLFSDRETKTMVRRIWEENIHSITNLTTMKVTSSGISTPLGPLTIPHVESAMRVLKDIKNEYSHVPYNSGELDYYNSKYFSMIPHPFGMKIDASELINDDNKFMVEFDLLEQMKSAIMVGGEDATEEQVHDIGVNVEVVDPNSPVWKALNKQYINSKADCHSHMKQYHIKNIFQVDHNNSTERYEHLDERFKTEEFDLFHGSRSCNIMSIMMNGLIVPPKTAGHVTGRMFSDGVYAASASTKALNYATGYWSRSFNDKHPQVYMFVVRFAMGNIFYPTGTLYNGPPQGYDSVWAKSHKTNLANDEYIVYNTSQAKLTHLIQLES